MFRASKRGQIRCIIMAGLVESHITGQKHTQISNSQETWWVSNMAYNANKISV